MAKLLFVEVHGFDKASPRHDEVVVELRRDNWDDYTFKTFFHVVLFLNFQHTVDLGKVKILRAGMHEGRTPLPPSPFESLDETYCALGQEASYYETLMAVPQDVRDLYLAATRDAATSPAIEEAFAQEPGWSTSLLRFGQAEHALETGKSLFRQGRQARPPGIASFDMNVPFGHEQDPPVRFEFGVEGGLLPGRCNVFIGYNGAGKTRLLSRLALAASRGDQPPELKDDGWEATVSGDDATFGSVVTVAYSAFDNFEVPTERLADAVTTALGPVDDRTEFHGWTYCGLRVLARDQAPGVRDRLKTQDDVVNELLRALEEAQSKKDGQPLRRALGILATEPSFARIGVNPEVWADSLAAATQDISGLSTGHQIVANILVQLASHLQSRSLVLIDEPESHLHPPLLATLLRALHSLLDDYDSFCVMATHSPVVLQELPSRYVKVLDRVDTQNFVEAPDIEVFGENIGAITRHVFNLDNTVSDYQGIIARLATQMPLWQIESLFPEFGLSGPARTLAANQRPE